MNKPMTAQEKQEHREQTIKRMIMKLRANRRKQDADLYDYDKPEDTTIKREVDK